ncbi:Fanconi anemia group M protein-like protein [Hypsibius exemplaris]|uniref:Fanconi anemia group M protein-like protein n=1 Tax=Hypsibius exemplaris TaxID=2072580 RepID=A0A9X6RNC2_HYPEX|nr:Fanconi anemia group M protein-like protein [Hypsibius exemplaris]
MQTRVIFPGKQNRPQNTFPPERSPFQPQWRPQPSAVIFPSGVRSQGMQGSGVRPPQPRWQAQRAPGQPPDFPSPRLPQIRQPVRSGSRQPVRSGSRQPIRSGSGHFPPPGSRPGSQNFLMPRPANQPMTSQQRPVGNPLPRALGNRFPRSTSTPNVVEAPARSTQLGWSGTLTGNTAPGMFGTGQNLPQVKVESAFSDDDDDEGLLAAMDAYVVASQEVEEEKPVVTTVKLEEGATDAVGTKDGVTDAVDNDDLFFDIDLEHIESQAEDSVREVAVSFKPPPPVQQIQSGGMGVSEKAGPILRVVATSMDGPDKRPQIFVAAPGSTLGEYNKLMRQPTIENLAPETMQFLDALPANAHVPVNVEVLPGFDVHAGLTWLYPTNYPPRDYQYNIVQKALFRNTMVTLPTGLGKTFVAAVVMYNFYRWYPTGKILFMAPTRPLVAQQMRACYTIMGIPQNEMVELTGMISTHQRQALWTSHRLFFMTPQTAVNDLLNDRFEPTAIKCIVIDEAHKATKAYAYCEFVRILSQKNSQYRVLALSATPGNDPAAIQEVLTNLHIAHMEIRQEDSIDIIPYTHKKTVEQVIVPLDDTINEAINRLGQIMLPYVETCRRAQGIPGYVDNSKLTSFGLMMYMREFTSKNTMSNGFLKQKVITSFMVAHTLMHAYELLQCYGFRAFYTSIHDKSQNGLARHTLSKNADFNGLMERVKELLEKDLSVLGVDGLMDTSSIIHPDRPYIYGHPKLRKLEEIVLAHFQQAATTTGEDGVGKKPDSRIMIFTSLRDSVQEISSMLKRHDPVVRVKKFIGQSGSAKRKGFTQKEQAEVLNLFRSGRFNVLVSTSVGEEGLDIGEVDLIICFDTQKSALRGTQRTGRTGRKRQGRCIMLLSEGTGERQKYEQCKSNKGMVKKNLLRTDYKLYADNPRMVPSALKPLCVRLKLDSMPEYVEGGEAGTGKKSKKAAPIKGDMHVWLRTKPTSKETAKFEHKFLTDAELMEYNRFCKVPSESNDPVAASDSEEPASKFLFNPLNNEQLQKRFRDRESVDYESIRSTGPLSLTRHAAFQILEQPTKLMRHSSKSSNFVATMSQLNTLSMASSSSSACDADVVRLYRLAARAGLIDMDGLSPHGWLSEPNSEENSEEPSSGLSLGFAPMVIRKRVSRNEMLCSLGTPDDEPRVAVRAGPSSPDGGHSDTESDEMEEGWEDERNETIAADDDSESSDEDETLRSYYSKWQSQRRVDHFRSPSESSDGDHAELALEDNFDVGCAVNDAVNSNEELKPEIQEGEGFSDLGLENWDTWDDMVPPVRETTDSAAAGGEVLVDHSDAPGEPIADEGSMLNESEALRVMNRTDVVMETPATVRKASQRRSIGSVVRSGRLDFDEEGSVAGLVVQSKQSELPFSHRLGVAAALRNGEAQPEAVEETLLPIAFPSGPQSYSTPQRDRTTRKLTVTMDVSPVQSDLPDRPPPSPSCVADSIIDEDEVPPSQLPDSELQPDLVNDDGPNEVPCSYPDEADFPEMDSADHPPAVEVLATDADDDVVMLNSTGPFQARATKDAAAVVMHFNPTLPFNGPTRSLQSTDPVESAVVVGAKRPLPKEPSRCVTPDPDDCHNFRRRKRVVAALETPDSAVQPGGQDISTSGEPSTSSAHRTPLKPGNRQHQIKKAASKRVPKPEKKTAKARLKALDFLDDEAEVSDDAECSSDEDEEDENDQDGYPASFLPSQPVGDDPSYMHAFYAQHNLYSPTGEEVLKRLGPRHVRDDVFSQTFEQDSDYGGSSFVVYSDEEEESPIRPPRKRAAPATESRSPPPAKKWANNGFQAPRRKN